MPRLTLNGMYEWEPSIFDGMILPADYDRDALLFEILQRSGQLYPYHQQPVILKEGIRLWFARNYLNFDRTMVALTAEYNPIENVFEDRKETTEYDSANTMTGGHKDTDSGQDKVTHSQNDYTERTYTDYKDETERTHTDYEDATERTYTNYNESTTKTGNTTNEHEVSAFDSGTYQSSDKNTETYNTVKDSKDITGSYKDSEKITGSYKDSNEITGSYKDNTVFGHVITTEPGKTTTRTYQTEKDAHSGKDTVTMNRHGNIGVTSAMSLIWEEIELRKFDIYVDIAKRFEHEFLVQVY